MTLRPALAALALPLLFGRAAAAQEAPPPPPFEVEVGWRFVNVSGSDEAYRTQLDDRPGFLLRSLTYSLPEAAASGFADALRIDAVDLGAGPAGSFRLAAGKTSVWSARLSYRRWDRFSAYGGWANPAFAAYPGLHRSQRKNDVLDFEVEALPGGRVTPFLGVTWNRLRGPSTTTIREGEDQFRLDSDQNDTETEVRAGATFDLGPVTGRVSQGWRFFRGDETLVLAAGASGGASSSPVFGKDQTLATYRRVDRTDVDTPVTDAAVSLRPVERLGIHVTFVRSSASLDASDAETLTGSFTSFPLRRFFTGLAESAGADADSTFWRGTARAEFAVLDGIDVGAGVARRDRDLRGRALIASLYTGTTDLNGLDPRDLQVLLEGETSLDRTEDELSVFASASRLGPLRLRASYARVDEDVTLRQDASQIVVPGSQDGRFERSVDRFEGSATLRQGPFTLGGQVRVDRSDDTIVRTDVTDRCRWRATASIDAPSFLPWIRLSGAYTDVDERNDAAGLAYRGRSRAWSASLEASPLKALTLRATAGRLQGTSSRLVRRPQDFVLETSAYADRATSGEAGATLTLPFGKLDGAFALVDGSGSFGYSIRRGRVTAEAPVVKGLTGILEGTFDRYREDDPRFGGRYSASRIGIYLRVAP